jgi:hypothetical protein
VSPTEEDLTVTQTAWQNLYFKENITLVGLSGMALQIQQLDFYWYTCKIHRHQNQLILIELK